jgi:hypothetical protein
MAPHPRRQHFSRFDKVFLDLSVRVNASVFVCFVSKLHKEGFETQLSAALFKPFV